MERDKTDPIDTTAVLELLTQGNSYQMPINDQVFDEIKEVVRRIDRYTKESTALKNRIHVYLDELYPQFEKQGTSLINTKSELVLESLLSHFHFTENIMALKGMGVVTLGRVIAYLNNPFRFENGSKAAQFAGLTPSKSQSGMSDKREKISRMGHKALRSVMIQLAHQLISSTAYFTAFYNRLVIEKGKDINLAVTATAHKIMRVVIKMIHSGEAFNPLTAKEIEVAKSKTKRFTKERKKEYQKMRKTQSGTQNMLETCLTRV